MRTKGVGPQGLGISKASPLKQTRKPDESRNLSSTAKPRKMTYRDAMRAQNAEEACKRERFDAQGTAPRRLAWAGRGDGAPR